MADVFISYASAEKDRAKLVAESLEAAGFSVWWDRALKPGETFDKVIQREIEAAKAVIVLWTRASVESQWVREEADHGRQRDMLIPLLMDEISPPIGFGRVQAAKLHDWDGDPKHHDWTEVIESVQALVGRAAKPVFNRPRPTPSPSPNPVKKGPPWVLIGAGVVIFVLMGVISLLVEGITTISDPQAQENLRAFQSAIEQQEAQAALDDADPEADLPPEAPERAREQIQPAPPPVQPNAAFSDPYAQAMAAVNPAAAQLQLAARAQGLTYVCVTPQGWCPMAQPTTPNASCWCPGAYGAVTGMTQ